MSIVLRGDTYYLDKTVGGNRIRCGLGATSKSAALRLENRIEFALADGPRSPVWQELKPVLPPMSYKTLTASLNLPPSPELSEFQLRFEARLDRREKLDEISPRTNDLYHAAADVFFLWLGSRSVRSIEAITPDVVEEFLIERKSALQANGGTGRGITTTYTTLQGVFNFAIEEGLIRTSPLKGKYKPDPDSPEPRPFTAQEIEKLEASVTAQDRLPYLLLRWTGLRASDAVAVTWKSINWTTSTLTWQTKKRGTWVVVPLHWKLVEELDKASRLGYVEIDQNAPILSGLTRAKLYDLTAQLGKRAGVEDCHPHRFRTSLACELLGRGASLFDVAKLLGDSHGVVEKYYATISKPQQDRVRNILESDGQKPEVVVG